MTSITLYVSPPCMLSPQVKRMLDDAGMTYTEIDVSKLRSSSTIDETTDFAEASGYTYKTPAISIDNRYGYSGTAALMRIREIVDAIQPKRPPFQP